MIYPNIALYLHQAATITSFCNYIVLFNQIMCDHRLRWGHLPIFRQDLSDKIATHISRTDCCVASEFHSGCSSSTMSMLAQYWAPRNQARKSEVYGRSSLNPIISAYNAAGEKQHGDAASRGERSGASYKIPDRREGFSIE